MGAFGRMLFAWVGGVFGALCVAVVEGQAAGVGVALSREPRPIEFVAADLAVLAPVAWLVASGVGALSMLLEPKRPIAPSERIAALRRQPVLARRHAAALLPVVALAATGWVVATAQSARAAMTEAAPMAAGVALATASLGWLMTFAALGLALAAPLRRRLSALAATTPRAIDPASTGAVGLTLGVLILALGVAIGQTGGEGPTPLAIFGVLKRRELDLRPVVDVAAIAACAWVSPLLLGARLLRFGSTALAVVIVLAAPALTLVEARALNRRPAVALAIESRAPLGRIGLALARRATDRDHDGASPYFGGGDCDDHNPAISPFAFDVPGNGVDEDCSGADEPLGQVTVPVARRAPAPTAAAGPPPSLVLITVDTLRASELGFMGYEKPTSPSLDAFAADAVVFERAYAMASYTGKALAPMLIGKYPSETLRDGGHFNKYFAGNVFLAERLRDAGFYTMGAAPHWYFKEASGLTQGFALFDLSAMPKSGQGETDTSVTSPQLTDVAIRLLERHAEGRRFFLWVHYFDPHAQYVPHAGAPNFAGRDKASRMRALYDGEVWFTDRAIGRLIAYIDAQPWGKSTVVALTSDHGEALDEHGIAFQHGFELWEPLMRVPLVVRGAGLSPHRVPVKRSAVDIVPTLLDVMRLPRPPRGELSGESMADDLAAASGSSYEERDVYLDMPDGPYTHMRRGLIHGATPGMKLIHFGGRQYQLYDLARDPDETDDLSGDPQRLGPMVDAMQHKRATLHEIAVRADSAGAP